MKNTLLLPLSLLLAALSCTATVAVAAAADQPWRVPLPKHVLAPRHSPGSTSRYRNVLARWGQASSSSSSSFHGEDMAGYGAATPRVFGVVDFGGDPTGVSDSTTAVNAAVSALLKSCGPGTDAKPLLDCGGATLDLQGGEFLISAPVYINPGYGNLRIRQGTLRASASFPSTRFVIETGSGGSTDGNNVDISISEVFLDAGHTAAGGIFAYGLFGGVFGPQLYVLNFTTHGIYVSSGHEVNIIETWLGEYWWTDPRKENGTYTKAVGIQFDGNDHIVDNVIVFSSYIGILINGEANIINNAHTWNLATNNGGIGIVVNASQTRLVGCYLDWNNLEIWTPQVISVTGTFLLCGARILLVAPASGVAQGVYIANTQLIGCSFPKYNVVETRGTFTSVLDVTVRDTLAQPGFTAKGTTATIVAESKDLVVSFTADFTDMLLFNVSTVPIQTITYSPIIDGETYVAHAARAPVGGVVTIETYAPITGKMVITVDQSTRTGPA